MHNELIKHSIEENYKFYDISVDPKELHNAINDKKYMEIIKQLKVELLKQKEKAGDSDTKYPVMQKIFSEYWN